MGKKGKGASGTSVKVKVSKSSGKSKNQGSAPALLFAESPGSPQGLDVSEQVTFRPSAGIDRQDTPSPPPRFAPTLKQFVVTVGGAVLDVSVAVSVKGTARLEHFQKAHPWVLMMEAPALRALATACMREHEDDSVSQWCRASAASKEQLERTSHSQANGSSSEMAQVLAQSGIMASLQHVKDLSCTGGKTTMSTIENWFKQCEEVMQVHATFAEQNPRSHTSTQARSIVLVTYASMKFKGVLKDTMTTYVKTHTQEQGEGPTWEAFKLRCLKDFAPRDQKVTETLSIFGICPGSHGNNARAITNWFDAKLSDILGDLKSTLEKEKPFFIAALWQQCVISLFKKANARVAKSSYILDYVDYLAKVENGSWPNGKEPPTLPHIKAKELLLQQTDVSKPDRTELVCRARDTVNAVCGCGGSHQETTGKVRNCKVSKGAIRAARNTIQSSNKQQFQKFKKRTEKFSAKQHQSLQSNADRFIAAVEGGEYDEDVANNKYESIVKSFEKQVPLGAAPKKQHRKRTDTKDRLDTKMVAALTGMQSTLAAMGENQASMVKRMRKMEKSSASN
jgi:hypothetical protein